MIRTHDIIAEQHDTLTARHVDKALTRESMLLLVPFEGASMASGCHQSEGDESVIDDEPLVWLRYQRIEMYEAFEEVLGVYL